MSSSTNKRDGRQRDSDSKTAGKLNYSKYRPDRLLRTLKSSSGWRITDKFKAAAAFFVVDNDGENFLSTSGTEGGKVRHR